MSTTYFADRAFIAINGKQLVHLKTAKWTIDEGIQRVETMTANKRTAGYKKGNKKVTGSFELDVEDTKAQIDLAFAYGNDVTIVATLGGGERYQLIGVVQTTQDLSGSVGETSKSINFEALDAINESGPTVNADIGL